MFIAQAVQEAGLLSNAGALIDPIDGGLLVFENASVDQIKEFVSNDPCKCIEDCTHACANQIYATPRYHLPPRLSRTVNTGAFQFPSIPVSMLPSMYCSHFAMC